MAGDPRKIAKIDTFHVWAYPAVIYRLTALNFFVRVLHAISNKNSRWCDVGRRFRFRATYSALNLGPRGSQEKLCLSYLQNTSTDLVQTSHADRA